MATEVHEGANGNLKKEEVEPLGALKPSGLKEDMKKPAAADLCNSAGDVNGCETLVAEKEEPLAKLPTPNEQKGLAQEGLEVEGGNGPQDGNDYSSDEEEGDGEGEGEGEEDAREADGEPDEEDDDEEYVDDGEEDDGDDDESQPPPNKRRK